MKREEEKKPTQLEILRQIRNDFGSFLYKKGEDGATMVMGRTGLSWGKIGLFFFVYYACLAGFFAALFAIAFSTMPAKKDGPKYTSFLADKPALLVYPKGGVSSYDDDSIDGVIKDYNSFLKDYSEQYEPCYGPKACKAGDSYRPGNETKQCYFNISSLGECAPSTDAHFGFRIKKPCLYLRLSKIYGWIPKPDTGNFVGIKCEHGNDTKVEYFPAKDKFFPISHWPFRGEGSFMTPIGAIRVNTAKTITLKCKAIADNIELSSTWKIKRGATGKLEFDVAGAPK